MLSDFASFMGQFSDWVRGWPLSEFEPVVRFREVGPDGDYTGVIVESPIGEDGIVSVPEGTYEVSACAEFRARPR